jgi:hypothetical protein
LDFTPSGGLLMRLVGGLGYGSLLGLAAFVVTSAGYTGCTGAVRQKPPPGPAACAEGEVPHTVGSQPLCCNGNDCHSVVVTSAQFGAPCSPGDADQAADEVTGMLDECVIESCSGDRVANDYLETAAETKGTLGCVAAGGAATWQWKGSVTEHRVARLCAGVRTVLCGSDGPGYAYSIYSDGCGCHTGPAGNPVCWDGSPCSSYGYRGVVSTITQREITLVSSTCSVDGAAVTHCPLGTL